MYRIAGLYVDMEPRYPKTIRQSKAYLTQESAESNIKIRLSDEFLLERQRENPHLTIEDCEYIWLGSEFYEVLPEFGAFLLHSSAVVYENEGFLFSAPCGTGKSTHTQIWLKRFEGAYILNDDKPAIRLVNDEFYVYGTPFSGKTDLNVNAEVPLKGICVLNRGEKNRIERVKPEEALFAILNQTVRPVEEKRMDKLLTILDRLILKVPVYKLFCNMELEAAEVSYCGMTGKKL
ncbi:MAG: hypothetical protein PUF72_04995 [Clostridiales bacterium]|nr:hypothetical protein [Clostridiales bacterium]